MIGWEEILVIIILALILLGPEKLTELARNLGKLYGEYKKAKTMFELEMLKASKIGDEDFKREVEKKYEELKIDLEASLNRPRSNQ
ncbi:MAG: twin-arginine translocase TatA/TatE family subunit [Archaeoglobaceae archaeon]|nr:twin-arginine translocase TatA/TatE family subunit [Archaeoglobaceae archaeon]MCX8152775.1 twin-arginine translocase TatA/TatE family subunit [Archaeoglobaceae archaeon]MDW8013482.1 twin-arginine translocase TatA/TatE family subunit [Archaeoglobaceae archaeon]